MHGVINIAFYRTLYIMVSAHIHSRSGQPNGGHDAMSVSNEVQGGKQGASDINSAIVPIIAALILLLKLLPSGTYINNHKQHRRTLVLIPEVWLPREQAAGCWPYRCPYRHYGHYPLQDMLAMLATVKVEYYRFRGCYYIGNWILVAGYVAAHIPIVVATPDKTC